MFDHILKDDITGDGTTSNVLIIGELLKQVSKLPAFCVLNLTVFLCVQISLCFFFPGWSVHIWGKNKIAFKLLWIIVVWPFRNPLFQNSLVNYRMLLFLSRVCTLVLSLKDLIWQRRKLLRLVTFRTTIYSSLTLFIVLKWCPLVQILEEIKITKEMDRDTLVSVARTSLRTKVDEEVADLLTEVCLQTLCHECSAQKLWKHFLVVIVQEVWCFTILHQ